MKRTDMAKYKSIGAMRAEACLEAFQTVLPNCETIKEAYERAAVMPAPRFFCTFAVAYKRVSELEKFGKRVDNPMKAAMYDEIHRRWKAKGVKHYVVLEDIINEPAPSFYVEPDTFKELVYKAMRNHKRKNKC